MFSLQSSGFSTAELEQFRHYQRVSYGVLEAVAGTLAVGETEHTVTRRIHRGLRAAGAENYFHVPVALFGDRTTYPGNFGKFEALPTSRRLAAQDVVILDVAPIFAGYTVDTSLAVRLGGEPLPRTLDQALAHCRADICARVNAGENMRDIARAIDTEITSRGLANCHKKHINAVVGHRVTRETRPYLKGRAIWGLAPRQVAWFYWRGYLAKNGRPALTPSWNHTRQSDCPPQDGLWAVEPHVAADGMGAKFEDILIIENGRARYLDDDLPHTRRWQAAGII